ncbi:hypothetical protein LTR84_005173 [Exophiala bonariae]|uniref:EKC/KEOPS complex subunit BUD32 n=1 Tax=Exophiala bonariae TaxID=1690606 RepID=A0AAV9NPH1_9EURO|nr:hypothetical protein LTR84_005173 [Exophiala bonariae]
MATTPINDAAPVPVPPQQPSSTNKDNASTEASQPEQQPSQLTPTTTTTFTHALPAPFNTPSSSSTPAPTLITQGAEALLYRTTFLTASTPAALKFRPSKPYRHATLDARLTKQRVLAEARVLVKLASLRNDPTNEVNVPAVLALEWDVARKVKGGGGLGQRGGGGGGGKEGQVNGARGGAWLLMEWIEGASVKDLLRGFDGWVAGLKGRVEKTDGGDAVEDDAVVKRRKIQQQQEHEEENIKALLRRIGRAVGALHSQGGVIHGDLTTSNIMIRPLSSSSPSSSPPSTSSSSLPPDLTGAIYLIDFGLATQSMQDEDRAVDLYVLERAFGSTHPRQEDWFDAEVLQSTDGYRGSFKGAGVVLKRLEEVRLRGRKRSMVG